MNDDEKKNDGGGGKPSNPSLYVSFLSDTIHPDRVPFSVLSDALTAVNALAFGPRRSSKVEPGEDRFRLVGVRSGSARYRLAAPPAARFEGRLRRSGLALVDPTSVYDLDQMIEPISTLTRIASGLGCRITVRSPETGRKPLLSITGDSFEPIKNLMIEGETEIAGRIMRVGGATGKRCSIRREEGGNILYCSVDSEQVAQELGKRLYQHVIVGGRAKWLMTNWRIVEFTIRSVYQPRRGNIIQAIQAIREAGGKDWDRIDDPKAFLEGLGE